MTAPKMPTGLRPAEQKAWKRVVDEFGADSLEPSDTSLLLGMAILYARFDDLRALLYRQEGDTKRRGKARRQLPYLLEGTARGVTTNPLVGHERETIKEIRLLHERIDKLISERRGSRAPERPKSLREVRESLHAVPPRRSSGV